MSLVVLGLAGELKPRDRRQALWAAHHHRTAAIRNLLGGDEWCAARARPTSSPTRPTRFSPSRQKSSAGIS